jgi:hypothetical protein
VGGKGGGGGRGEKWPKPCMHTWIIKEKKILKKKKVRDISNILPNDVLQGLKNWFFKKINNINKNPRQSN